MRIVAAAAAALLALLPAGGASARSHHPTAVKATAHAEHRPSQLDLAARGNAEAQYQVGMATLQARDRREFLHAESRRDKLYARDRRDGRHAPDWRDERTAQALVWLGLAAGNGNAAAAAEGARLHEQAGDLAEAARWWLRAGQLGDADARTRFVDLFLDGRTADLGGAAGADWLAARAGAGDVRAKLALGEALERGSGVAVDLRQAQHWYLDAALDGDTEAMYRLGRVQIHLPAVWRAPGKETGRDGRWMGPVTYPLTLAGRDHDSGEADLGRAATAAANNLDRGDLTFFRPGMVEGEQWLKRAAWRGHAGAEATLARAELGGIDLPSDIFDAVRWLQAAAGQGDADAMLTLGGLAAAGHGFPAKDPVRAWVCDDLAASLGADGAAAARDLVGKTLAPRQLTRAHQIAQDVRDLDGLPR